MEKKKTFINQLSKVETKYRQLKIEISKINHDKEIMRESLRENEDKLNSITSLPLLVATISEIIYQEPRKTKKKTSFVVKASNRLTIYLRNSGLIDSQDLRINNLVALNRDNHSIIRKLPPEFDSRVKAMEIESKPAQSYHDIGGLDTQIQELIEAIVLPITQQNTFLKLGIFPPKGVLLHGPPGMGKTLMARACAAQTQSHFLKLAGPQLVQMYIGEGAGLIREAFKLAKEKAPTIIFIDEIDAIGTKRFDSETNGDREVQRTMLELLNQLDGFTPTAQIKVIAATNRIDILDSALLRSGRLDRKIRFPYPDIKAREKILAIHSRKLKISEDVNFKEIASQANGFNGAELKALSIEAGMNAIRNFRRIISHSDFIEAFSKVKIKRSKTPEYLF